MEIQVTQSSEITVVAPKGDLDTASAARMKQTLGALLDAGKTRLVVDLGGVAYMDSAGLGQLVNAMKLARKAGGDLRLCALSEETLRVFETTRLNKEMALYPTRQAAIASWR